MEAYFDNKGNILNASMRINRDHSAIYTLRTNFGLRGRKVTILKDDNPPFNGPSNVGAIFWADKAFEIHGQRKPIAEILRKEGRFFKKTRYWKWGTDRKEYQLIHDHDGWKAILNQNMSIAARFLLPPRPHIFGKADPPVLHLTKAALERDEIFLILLLIYSEVKRQDETNSSSANGGVGW